MADHVDDVLALVDRLRPAPVVLVGASYSGTVVGQVADRRPDVVVGSVHIGSFLPRDGRSLLDDWGDDPAARAAERQQVRDDGLLWASPPAELLEAGTDLSAGQRGWLADRFAPHPGRTVLDPAVMSRPVSRAAGRLRRRLPRRPAARAGRRPAGPVAIRGRRRRPLTHAHPARRAAPDPARGRRRLDAAMTSGHPGSWDQHKHIEDEDQRMRTLPITQNITVDGSIEMLGDWFHPSDQEGLPRVRLTPHL